MKLRDDQRYKNEEEGESSDWEDETADAGMLDSNLGFGSPIEEAYLIVLGGSRIGAMAQIQSGMVIGRGDRADFRTPDDGVSRLHLRLTKTREGILAEDLQSRNGTYVNGQRVTSVLLKDGDKIRIGSTTILKFSYADKLEESFQREMYNAALRDPLTQTYNRRYFNEQLESEFYYAIRHHSDLSLILIDIDHFKKINDAYGHLTGDAVLAGLTTAIKKLIRCEDLLTRYGGEEFALLCRWTSGHIGLSIANRIRTFIEQAQLVPSIPELKVAISAGVASLPENIINTPQAFFDAADKALYQAKRLGRNRVCMFDAQLSSP